MNRRFLASQMLQFNLRNDWKSFQSALKSPQEFQEKILQQLIRANQQTAFGKHYNFADIKSVADFQKQIPLSDFEFYRNWVDRIVQGELQILTNEQPLIFERTSGSTSKNKIIPFTKSFFQEMRSAIHPWLYECYKKHPDLHGTAMYWSMSPVTQKPEVSPAGIPIGVSDDSEYFSLFTKLCLRELIVLPKQEAFTKDHQFWKTETCKALVCEENLGFISVWSPTFLIILLEEIESNLEKYLSVLDGSRRTRIEKAIAQNKRLSDALWPKLQIVSCWTDAGSANFLEQLFRWVPQHLIQPKGLLATEGCVSLPFAQEDGCPLAVTSHFLEFIDLNEPSQTPLLAHQLEKSRFYSPVITTASGLYRYHLKDTLQCTGYLEKTPLIKFMGKLEQTSDLCGEKLSFKQVHEALILLEKEVDVHFDFKMLIPVNKETRGYRLVASIDDTRTLDIQKVEQVFDTLLCRNVHYKYAREIGQLAMVSLHVDNQALEKYNHRLMSLGRRFGDIKTTVLDPSLDWQNIYNKT